MQRGFNISTRTACIIGGLVIGAVLFDSYQERQLVRERLDVVEQQTKQTAADIQEIKDVLIHSAERITYTQDDEKCLAKNIYHEAGVESKVGKVAVGQVTINRLKTGRWGDNICDVVYAKEQFSWTLSKKLKNEEPKGQLWEDSLRVTAQVLAGLRVKSLTDSLFYHTDYISLPAWVEPSALITQIDQHKFYTKAKFVLKKKKPKEKRKHRRVNT
jgi:spore germination cell wall hydrolase CwlJ-like protein